MAFDICLAEISAFEEKRYVGHLCDGVSETVAHVECSWMASFAKRSKALSAAR